MQVELKPKCLKLLSRSYCHLCHAMEEKIRERLPHNWQLEIIDVDMHPQLQEKYDEQVPILLAGSNEIFYHFFDSERWDRLFTDEIIF